MVVYLGMWSQLRYGSQNKGADIVSLSKWQLRSKHPMMRQILLSTIKFPFGNNLLRNSVIQNWTEKRMFVKRTTKQF